MYQRNLGKTIRVFFLILISGFGLTGARFHVPVSLQEGSNPNGKDQYQKAHLQERAFGIIERRLKGSSLGDLRTQPVNDGSVEIRIWYGFTEIKLLGFVLKDVDQHWSASYIPHMESENTRNPIPLRTPKSGWKSFWKTMDSFNIYTLPDAADIGQVNATELGARAILVEIKTPEKYRSYLYGGYFGDYPTPNTPHNETWKAWQILKTLSDEFGKPL